MAKLPKYSDGTYWGWFFGFTVLIVGFGLLNGSL